MACDRCAYSSDVVPHFLCGPLFSSYAFRLPLLPYSILCTICDILTCGLLPHNILTCHFEYTLVWGSKTFGAWAGGWEEVEGRD